MKEESRPKILTTADQNEEEEEEESKDNEAATPTPSPTRTICDPIISSLIRKCWTQDPKQRPNPYEICSLLQNKIQKDLSQDIVIVNL